MNPREVVILAGARTGMCRYGLATACIGGGQGIALIVESVP